MLETDTQYMNMLNACVRHNSNVHFSMVFLETKHLLTGRGHFNSYPSVLLDHKHFMAFVNAEFYVHYCGNLVLLK